MESTPEQSAEGVAVVRVLASVLERLVSANSHLGQNETQVTKFHALRAPSISILQYLERIHKYACCSTEAFILALIYLDRLIQRNNFLLTHLNAHRVIISAVLVAAKFFDDAYYNNAYYAKVGGVTVSELNSLEVEFLFRINFSLRVSPELYRKYHEELLSHAVATNSSEEVAVMLAAAADTDRAASLAAALSGKGQHDPECLVNGSSIYAQLAPQAPLMTLNKFSSSGNLLGVVNVEPAKENEHNIITPSSTSPLPHHPFYGQGQKFIVGSVHHMQQSFSSVNEKYLSNLAAQLHHHHHILYQNATYPAAVVSETVSMCDSVESDTFMYHQKPRQHIPLIPHHYTVYNSSSTASNASLMQTNELCVNHGYPLRYHHSLPQQQHGHHQPHVVESVYVTGVGN